MIKHIVKAARLRTLPLSLSGILLGALLSFKIGMFIWDIFFLSVLVTIGFQVISNFANDYGDGVKGTDNENRIGPKRAIQSGVISPKSMLIYIVLLSILTFFISLYLIYRAFDGDLVFIGVFLLFSVLSIVAAITYTMGRFAYGYYGLGDFFVFIFFGILSVLGSCFLYTSQLDFMLLLPATTIGFLSIAVLNLNNMRDHVSDKISKKHTIVVKNGLGFAKKYHFVLIIISLITALIFVVLNFNINLMFQFLFLIFYIPLAFHLRKIFHVTDPVDFDPELKKVALLTFLIAVSIGIGQII